jgi:aminoglycoside 3-N-acetyltransferase
LRSLLGPRTKNRLRALRTLAHDAVVRRFLSYTPKQFVGKLNELGIKFGDHVLLHSAFGSQFGFRGSPGELIESFLEAVGPDGGLFMVSMPYSTSAAAYLKTTPTFDVRKTASRMGLVPESFRRRTGVLRSLHPTHPILGFGPLASEVLTGHEASPYGCGTDTPFERLHDLNAKIVFFNVTLDCMTYLHHLEHLVAHVLPFPLYESDPVVARVIDWQGGERQLPVYAFSNEAFLKRRPQILHKWLTDAGLVARMKIGATTVLSLNMQEITVLVKEEVRAGHYFHDVAQ